MKKVSLINLNEENAEFKIPVGHTTIGRADDCSIVFRFDQRISRKHFSISFDGESVFIEDAKSTNGTFVNGEKITEKTELKNGDRITCVLEVLRIEIFDSDQTKQIDLTIH